MPDLLHRFEDPADSRDPQIRALVGALATLEVAPPARPDFRAELRAQLVAITPRIVAESAQEAKVAAAKTAAAPARARRRIPIGRPLLVAASLVTVLAVILGGAVWMSRKALPGDSLYGLKRASENFQLSLDGNDTDRAHDLLDFASTRAEEANALAGRPSASGVGPQAGAASPANAKLITSTLSSADGDLERATRLLAGVAVRNRSTQPLALLIGWSPEQSARLSTLAAAVPAGTLRERVLSSSDVLDAAVARAKALQTDVAAHRVTLPADNLGPVPCTANCATTNTGPGTRVAPQGGSTSTAPRGATTSTKPAGTLPSGVSTKLPTKLPTKVPTKLLPSKLLPSKLLPSKLPSNLVPHKLPASAPVSVNKSCVSASVVIGITVGHCSGH